MWAANAATVPGARMSEHATRANILNPARMDYVSASDTCIQCHSQGRPLTNPIEGKYYDWPVGYRVGLNLRDYWQLEDHKLGELSFTHFPEGTAHKNRMQGNDFVQSVMYRRGVTCFDCHDVHGTKNYAQLRKPVNEICLDCHGPGSRNGPREATLAEHTHHKDGSAGQRMRGLPHAEDRGRDSRRLRARAHLRLHHSGDDGQIQDSESVHVLPHGQEHRMGRRCHAPLGR